MALFAKIPPLVWLLLSGVFFGFGEFASKQFATAPSWHVGIMVVGLYACATLLWLPAIAQTNQLAITGALWSALSLLVTVLIGLVYFRETVSPLGMVGLGLAIAAVFCLSLAQE